MSNGKKPSFGGRSADELARLVGSWKFIILLSGVLVLWVALNTCIVIFAWDPYPFIFLNLFLSMMAAFQAPVILMSQNRAAEQDRMKAATDLSVDRKAESEIRDIQRDLEEIKSLLHDLQGVKPKI